MKLPLGFYWLQGFIAGMIVVLLAMRFLFHVI